MSPDLDPAVMDAIMTLVNARLDENRRFNNPADDIIEKVENLCLEVNNKQGSGDEQGSCGGNESETETETETEDVNESENGGGEESQVQIAAPVPDHGPSDLDPATLDEIRRLDPVVLEKILKLGPSILDQIRIQNAEGLPAGDRPKDKQVSKDKGKEKEAEKPVRTEIKNDFKSEGCKNGKASKSNHSRGQTSVTPVGENFMGLLIPPVSKDKAKGKEELTEKPGRPKSKNDFKSEGCKSGKASKFNHSRGQPSVTPVRENFMGLPIPPNDVRSEGCRHGKASMSKSNHSRGQPSVGENFTGLPSQPVFKDKAKEKEKLAQNPGRTESKVVYDHNDFRSEKCNSGKARMSNYSKGQPSVAPAGENFLGLPIRPGKKKCPHYMENGSCKYGLNCMYTHPDPTAAGESHPLSIHGNDGPSKFQGASASTVEQPSAPRALNKTRRHVRPSQRTPSQNIELNAYQAPANLPERSMSAPQPYGIDNSVTENTTYQQHPLKKQVKESPAQPGQPVCKFFSKAGYCYKSTCNYDHPKYQTSVSPLCELSDKGLPLRPGKNICAVYDNYGICSSGPSCKFDHPSLPPT